MKKIAFVSYASQEKYLQGVSSNEDLELLNFLSDKGLDVTSVIWNDPTVNWQGFDAVVIKSPWDYHENIVAFHAWLDMLKHLEILVLNPVSIIKWNSDKRYLKQIADKGLNVIPTQYLEQDATFEYAIFDLFGAEKVVVKPCVSAGAKNTITVGRDNFPEKKPIVDKLLQEDAYLVQPFIEEIRDGEWSFLFFNGEYSHSVLKIPKKGDFRVQNHLGGGISYQEPNPAHIGQAAEYLTILSDKPLYARVDGVLIDGTFQLMELELLEPYLYLNADTALLENYYRALVAQIALNSDHQDHQVLNF